MTRPDGRGPRDRPPERRRGPFAALSGAVRTMRAKARQEPNPHPWGKPAQLFLLVFVTVDLIGTGLLMTPVTTNDLHGLGFVDALFTATSALSVCGLTVLTLGEELNIVGQLIVLFLMQVGGIGIMTLASLLGVAVIHKFGLRMQLAVRAELPTVAAGDVSGVVSRVAKICLIVEGLVFLCITPRLWLGYDMSLGEAAYSGLFHSVSAFTNAGLALYSDSFMRFSGDPFILVPCAVAIILGAFGFPVLVEIRRRLRTPRRWSLHTKLTLTTTVVLYAAGIVLVTAMEWSNPATLGAMPWYARFTDGFFHGVVPRSGGFNSLATGEMRDSTLLLTIMLMFVGGGSGGTAGGIKVATLAVIVLVILAEVRGHSTVHVFDRQLPNEVIRQALSLIFLSATVIAVCTIILLEGTRFHLLPVLFEVVSAFGVVGMSTGITADLPGWGQCMLTLLMVAGRIGPITFVTALAFRDRRRRYSLAESRPIIG
ncbi:Trk-type K+ transport system, membrane component [Nocardiopsis flavescens]|uniref:Trk-type K+ transport system, membrane component n=2 Tax=Nocardiopsis flavescens TaxID=758803 RepID=A0A1M6DYD4_9ACTN|nr:Trk-type K+ transport system, membrane component [Nocardiopsis flavescens]